MALEDNYDLPRIPSFQRKIEVAMMSTARNVTNESINSNYLTYHNKRSELAKSILNGPQNYVEPFAKNAAAVGTLSYTSSDGDIQYVVNQIFDSIAGVRNDEKPPAP
jgi:hypothetical protein